LGYNLRNLSWSGRGCGRGCSFTSKLGLPARFKMCGDGRGTPLRRFGKDSIDLINSDLKGHCRF
jgi:hypothetical protein